MIKVHKCQKVREALKVVKFSFLKGKYGRTILIF